tara:strand:+ start:361 stop:576 length:216 start_codon:yes stop_codon:yes gene_type:complete
MDRNELKKSVVQLANSIEKLITSKDITDFDDYYKNYAKVAKFKLVEDNINKTKSYLGELFYIYESIKTENY